MTRGRKPKPTEQKKLQGNPGKRGLNKNEPKPDVVIPDCPEHLQGAARTEWKRITEELVKLKLISNVDRAALASYCEAWGMLVKASKKLKTQGEVITSDEGGMYQNPWLSIRNKSMEQVLKFSAEFGMTPSSRSRIKTEIPQPGEEGNGMEGFLFGNQSVKVTTPK